MLHRLHRGAASCRLARAGAELFAFPRRLGLRVCHGSGPRCARLGIRPARFRTSGQFHTAREHGFDQGRTEAWCDTGWHRYTAWLRGGMVGPPEMTALLAPDEPSPVRVLREDGRSDLFLTADHSGRLIPRSLDGLGLPGSELDR